MIQTEMIWLIVSLFFTLMIFSYLLGDNLFFRLTSYIFIGITAGYGAVLIYYQVILTRIVWPFYTGTNEQRALLVIPLVLAGLLLLKLTNRYHSLGNIPMGYLVGVGAAVIISGAVMGTIIGQTNAAINAFILQPGDTIGTRWVEGGILLLGAICTLAYFHFGSARKRGTEKRPGWIEPFSQLGKVFIGITLGALFIGVYSAALISLIDRLDFVWKAILQLFVLI